MESELQNTSQLIKMSTLFKNLVYMDSLLCGEEDIFLENFKIVNCTNFVKLIC